MTAHVILSMDPEPTPHDARVYEDATVAVHRLDGTVRTRRYRRFVGPKAAQRQYSASNRLRQRVKHDHPAPLPADPCNPPWQCACGYTAVTVNGLLSHTVSANPEHRHYPL